MSHQQYVDFEQVFMHAPIGMCVSHNRIIQKSNLALTKMFGYAPGELSGLSFMVLYPTADEFERTGVRLVSILNEKGFYSDERIMKRANDEMFWSMSPARRWCRAIPMQQVSGPSKTSAPSVRW